MRVIAGLVVGGCWLACRVCGKCAGAACRRRQMPPGPGSRRDRQCLCLQAVDRRTARRHDGEAQRARPDPGPSSAGSMPQLARDARRRSTSTTRRRWRAFRQLLEQRDAVFRRSTGAMVADAQPPRCSATTTAVAHYNEQCANRPMRPDPDAPGAGDAVLPDASSRDLRGRRPRSYCCRYSSSGATCGAAISAQPPSRQARKKQLRRPVWQATPCWSTSSSTVSPSQSRRNSIEALHLARGLALAPQRPARARPVAGPALVERQRAPHRGSSRPPSAPRRCRAAARSPARGRRRRT